MHRRYHSSAAIAGCVAALSLPASRAALAQIHNDPGGQYRTGGSYGMMSYEAALPTGDASTFLGSNMSWLGLSFAGHKYVRENVTLGFEAGINEFHDRSGGTFQLEQGATTGSQYRHLLQFPLLVTGRYYLGEGGSGRVGYFAGLGLGTYYTRQLLDFGVNEYTAEAWQFGVAPELGLLLHSSNSSVLQFRVRYNYPVSSGDWIGGGGRSFNNVSFGIGAGFHH